MNPAGGLVGASFSVTLTTTLPPVVGDTLMASMVFDWARSAMLAVASNSASVPRRTDEKSVAVGFIG
ncbi:hypothetical protein D3C83_221430 [compost metagenome]